MAAAVGDVLADGGTLLVEAATGTGKSLAYLIPAVESGDRVIVSTGTKNLQDQIWHHDLPFIRERLGLPVRACVMKGRQNYLCRTRLAALEDEPLFEDLAEREWLPRLSAWSRETETGDRAEIADMPDGLRLWRAVDARADTCTGTKCPEYERCFLTTLKRRAQASDVVVVNHHLFFADLAVRTAYGAVLPDYDTVVFDEAHLIEDVATLYFGVQVSSGQIEELARDAEAAAARLGGPSRGGGGAASLRLAAHAFLEPLRGRLRGATGRRPFAPPERGGVDVEAEWAELSEALDEVQRQAGRLERLGGQGDSVGRRAEELRLALDHVLRRDDPRFVYGIEARGRGGVALAAQPIDVAEPLRERLFDGLRACVLTSATLTVAGGFDFVTTRLGLGDAEALTVESSFDYASQAALYLPRDMPEPRDPGFVPRAVERIRELLDVTDGRAFLLFTSWANLDRVREALDDDGRWPLVVQGEGSKAALVERFKTTPRAVLLGTASFWHGVDVPGDRLSLVVIDKLPFDVPDDPLVAARIERIRGEGGNPFMAYQVPLAVLELKQGLGRLLRGRGDRGLLSVLDPRLTGRRYGRIFLDSLPPYTRVDDLDACRRFMRGEPAP